MRVITPGINELSEDWKQARPQLQREVRRLSKAISQNWDIQHTTEGGHTDITASSLQIQGARVGEWVDLPYANARFGADPGVTWDVTDANSYDYVKAMRLGALVVVLFRVVHTGLDGSSAQLKITLPEFNAIPNTAIDSPRQLWGGGTLTWADNDAGNAGIGQVFVTVQQTGPAVPQSVMQLSRISPTNATFQSWPLSTSLDISGSMMFPVNPSNVPLPYSFT